jgi:hypothetical protein
LILNTLGIIKIAMKMFAKITLTVLALAPWASQKQIETILYVVKPSLHPDPR